VFPLPEAMGSTRNMLASLGLRWWQHIIVRGVHKHCIAAEVTSPTKAVFTPSIRLCPSDPAIPFKLYRRRFQSKIAFAMTISKAQGQALKRVRINALTSVFSNGQICDIFPTLFISQRRWCNYWRASTANTKWKLGNIRHCISRSTSKLHIHK
jgi:hypothetical protein